MHFGYQNLPNASKWFYSICLGFLMECIFSRVFCKDVYPCLRIWVILMISVGNSLEDYYYKDMTEMLTSERMALTSLPRLIIGSCGNQKALDRLFKNILAVAWQRYNSWKPVV